MAAMGFLMSQQHQHQLSSWPSGPWPVVPQQKPCHVGFVASFCSFLRLCLLDRFPKSVPESEQHVVVRGRVSWSQTPPAEDACPSFLPR